MTAPTQSLFRAKRPRKAAPAALDLDLPAARAPDQPRRKDDFYATTDTDCIRGLLARDGARIAELGRHVWEPAVGAGHLAREMQDAGLAVTGWDIVDRGHPDTLLRDFFTATSAPAPAIITNPPYDRISAGASGGAWLRHTLALPGWDYCAYLLNWDWPAARSNGLEGLLATHAFSWCYLMRWKIDFTGAGSPPQRNAWFVWDRAHPRGFASGMPSPEFRVMDREDGRKLREGGLW